MVPRDQPAAAQVMLMDFINKGGPLAEDKIDLI